MLVQDIILNFLLCHHGSLATSTTSMSELLPPATIVQREYRTWKVAPLLPKNCPGGSIQLEPQTYELESHVRYANCRYIGVRGTLLSNTFSAEFDNCTFQGDMHISGDLLYTSPTNISSPRSIALDGKIEVSGDIRPGVERIIQLKVPNNTGNIDGLLTVNLKGGASVRGHIILNRYSINGGSAKHNLSAFGQVNLQGCGTSAAGIHVVAGGEEQDSGNMTVVGGLSFGKPVLQDSCFASVNVTCIFAYSKNADCNIVLVGQNFVAIGALGMPKEFDFNVFLWVLGKNIVVDEIDITSHSQDICHFGISTHGTNITVSGLVAQVPFGSAEIFIDSRGDAVFKGVSIGSNDADPNKYRFVGISGNITFIDARIFGSVEVHLKGKLTFIRASIESWERGLNIEGNASFRDCHNGCLKSERVNIQGTVSFMNCSAGSQRQGGAIWVSRSPFPNGASGSRSVSINGSASFINCTCADSGGAIYVDTYDQQDTSGRGQIDLGDVSFINCSAGFAGGAIWSEVPVAIHGRANFAGCAAFVGGAVYGSKGPIDFHRPVSFESCKASADGGAVFAYNFANIQVHQGARFQNCIAGDRGGAICASATVKLLGNITFAQTCAPNGAVLNVEAGNIELTGSTFIERSYECSFSTPSMLLNSATPYQLGNSTVGLLVKDWIVFVKQAMPGVPLLGADGVARIQMSNVEIEGTEKIMRARRVTDVVSLSSLNMGHTCGRDCLDFSHVSLQKGTLENIALSCRPGTFVLASKKNETGIHSETFASPIDCTDHHECCRRWHVDRNVTCDIKSATCVCQTDACNTCLVRNVLHSYSLGCSPCSSGTISLIPDSATMLDWNVDLASHSSSTSLCLDCGKLRNAVGELEISCNGTSLTAAAGAMVLTSSGGTYRARNASQLQAHRCPNPMACPGGRLSATPLGVLIGIESMCSHNYAYSAGCTSCRYPVAGRAMWNGLQCGLCGPEWMGWFVFIGQPAIIFVLGAYSAMNLQASRMSEIWNILLQFGTTAGVIFNIVTNSVHYTSLTTQMRSLLGLAETLSTVSVYSGSLDCLYQSLVSDPDTASKSALLLLQVSMPMLIFLAIVATRRSSAQPPAYLIRNLLVLSTMFLPNIMASFLRWAPCMKTNNDVALVRVYAPSQECSVVITWLAIVGALMLFFFIGPYAWFSLIKRDYRRSDDRHAYIGKLVYRYREEVDWWEIVVLTRRALLTSFAVLWPAGYASGSQLAGLIVVLFISVALHCDVWPYKECEEEGRSLSLNQIECGTLVASMMSLAVVVAFVFPVWGRSQEVSVFVALTLFVLLGGTACVLLYLFIMETRSAIQHHGCFSLYGRGRAAHVVSESLPLRQRSISTISNEQTSSEHQASSGREPSEPPPGCLSFFGRARAAHFVSESSPSRARSSPSISNDPAASQQRATTEPTPKRQRTTAELARTGWSLARRRDDDDPFLLNDAPETMR